MRSSRRTAVARRRRPPSDAEGQTRIAEAFRDEIVRRYETRSTMARLRVSYYETTLKCPVTG